MKIQHDILNNQKETATYWLQHQVLALLLCSVLTITAFLVSRNNSEGKYIDLTFLVLSVISCIPSIIFLIRFFYGLKNRLMFNKIAFIFEDTNEIICKKFHLLFLFDGQHNNHITHYAGIVFTDTNNKNYTYFFPDHFQRDSYWLFRKFVKDKAVGKKLTIKHYAGTNLLTECPVTLYDYKY